MKTYSVARRVVSLVLLVELLAALGVTGFAFFYERHAHFRSFDVSLQGRADTVMGAVEDADDQKLGVMLDTTDLKLPEHDVFAVREEGKEELGRTQGWNPAEALWAGGAGFFSLEVDGHSYRGIRLRGVRVVDPMAGNVRHPITILYAAPTRRVWGAVRGAVAAFALANGLLILLTALIVPGVIRRSLAPLRALAGEAEGVSANAWGFAPKDEVRAVAELRPLVEAMEAVLGRLERSFTQQRQFVGDAAHELKTAVAVVKSSIQLLELRARTPAEYEQGLKRCYADCLRMEELAQNMLLLARVEEGLVELGARAELEVSVQAAVKELQPFAELRGVRVTNVCDSDAVVGIAPEMLRSLLINLVMNAVQHSAAGGEVLIDVERAAEHMMLRVRDTGAGIASEALPFLFDRFFRGDASRSRKTGGTGLGLAICKAIVERARGRIAVESKEGHGTTVTVTLPLYSAAPHTVAYEVLASQT